jgi:hypothetical protein
MRQVLGHIAIALILLSLDGCKKDQDLTQPAIPSTPEETVKLLIGNWIEDSLRIDNIENSFTIPFDPPSYLTVDSNMYYRLVQTSVLATPGNGFDETDTGQIKDIGTRYITPTSFYDNQNFLGSFGKMQVDTLNAHRMILYGYSMFVPPTFYFHK